MSSLRPTSVSDTTPLQRFESQSSSGEEPSSPTAASIVAAAAAASASPPQPSLHSQLPQQQQQQQHHHYNNNNNVKVDLQLPPFVGVPTGAVGGKPRTRGTSYIFKRIFLDLSLLSCGKFLPGIKEYVHMLESGKLENWISTQIVRLMEVIKSPVNIKDSYEFQLKLI